MKDRKRKRSKFLTKRVGERERGDGKREGETEGPDTLGKDPRNF